MANRKVEEYAYRNDCSNKEAKRRLGSGARSGEGPRINIARGAPVKGTGKPKGAQKG